MSTALQDVSLSKAEGFKELYILTIRRSDNKNIYMSKGLDREDLIKLKDKIEVFLNDYDKEQ